MRDLTAIERDALTEVCNIGVSQAAKQLSLLLSDEVEINVPSVTVVEFDHMSETLGITDDQTITCVKQTISGDLVGVSSLLFHDDQSRGLIASLIGNVSSLAEVDMREFEHEAMTEIGNIIMSACLSSIANFLSQVIQFSVPVFFRSSANEVFGNIKNDISDEAKVAIVLNTRMCALNRGVEGVLLLTFTVPSMEYLTDRLVQVVSGYANAS